MVEQAWTYLVETLGPSGPFYAVAALGMLMALAALPDKRAGAKLCDDSGPRYADRPGGYTRIVKLMPRKA